MPKEEPIPEIAAEVRELRRAVDKARETIREIADERDANSEETGSTSDD